MSPRIPTGEAVDFTLIDAGRVVATRARIDGDRVRLPEAALESALGWTLDAGVLCHEGVCVPMPGGVALADADGVDLAALATVLDRPLALDTAERVAYVGTPAGERRRALASLEAPDFTLPDLAGRPHSLSEHRGRKVFLVAWASW